MVLNYKYYLPINIVYPATKQYKIQMTSCSYTFKLTFHLVTWIENLLLTSFLQQSGINYYSLFIQSLVLPRSIYIYRIKVKLFSYCSKLLCEVQSEVGGIKAIRAQHIFWLIYLISLSFKIYDYLETSINQCSYLQLNHNAYLL